MINYWQEAIDAVFYANPEKVKELIDGGHFYPRLLMSTGLLDSTFPIWIFPQLWEAAIDDPNDWKDEYQPKVLDFLERVHKVKDILHKSFGIDYAPIDYTKFLPELAVHDAGESIEDIVGAEYLKMYRTNGRRMMDIELYCALMKFDVAIMKELLVAGANPKANFPDTLESVYETVGYDCGYYAIAIWEYIEASPQRPVEDCMLYKLLRRASSVYLYKLLEEYDTTSHETKHYNG